MRFPFLAFLAPLPVLLAAATAPAQTAPQTLPPAAAQAAAPARVAVPAEGEAAYLVKRDGEPIGSLVMKATRDGQRTTVVSDYGIQIRLMSIVLYRYDKRMVETYEDGRLVAYEAAIDDNGTKSGVRATRDGDRLAIVHPKGSLTAPLGTLVTTYWLLATVQQTRMIDSSDGIIVDVAVAGPVAGEIRADGRTLKADRYAMTGDLERELWYAADGGEWLGMRMKASDGSTIEILRDWPPLWKRGLL